MEFNNNEIVKILEEEINDETIKKIIRLKRCCVCEKESNKLFPCPVSYRATEVTTVHVSASGTVFLIKDRISRPPKKDSVSIYRNPAYRFTREGLCSLECLSKKMEENPCLYEETELLLKRLKLI